MWQRMQNNINSHFGLTGYWLNFWVMVSCSTAMLLFGYDQGVFGSILTLTLFSDRFGVNLDKAKDYSYDVSSRQGIIVGSYDLGCLFGAAAIASLVGGRLGRKRTIFIGTLIMMVGAFLQTFSNDYGMMVAGRVIAGLGNGMNTVTAPIWATECSRPLQRGKNGVILMVVNILGLAIACWLTYALSYLKDSEISWRFPLAFQVVFGVIILHTVPWLPESPRWLMMKGRETDALAAMVALEGNGATAQSPTVLSEYEEISNGIDMEQGKGSTHRQQRPWLRLFLGVGTQAMQQGTGINIICYYLPVVLKESVGLNGELSRLLAGVNATTYLLATFVGLYFIERWGRRRLMMYGAVGQFFCWIIITTLLGAAKTATDNQIGHMDPESPMAKALSAGSAAFFFLFNMFFGAGWQGVSWLYPTEINTTQKRNLGMSLGVGTNWAINFAIVFVTPLGIEKLGYWYYLIFAILNLVFVFIIYLFYPETSSRSLEVIDQMYDAHPSCWVYKQRAMTARTLMPEDLENLAAVASRRNRESRDTDESQDDLRANGVDGQPGNEEAVEMEQILPKSSGSNDNDNGDGSSSGPSQHRSSGGENRARASTLEPTTTLLTDTPSIGQVISAAPGF